MSVFEKLLDGIKELFPSADDIEIDDDTQLEDIPDWDSMAAVNLMMFLQQTFNLHLPDGFLTGELKISELLNEIGE